MIKKANETGRSMVEMLGVLAIIGLLSVGGVSGYTLGTKRYQAGKILDVAGKLAGMGVGGTTYNSLNAAGLKVEGSSHIDMKLYPSGQVCVMNIGDNLEASFKAQAASFIAGDCEGEGILLDFKQ